MSFSVPKGESLIYHVTLEPVAPVEHQAQEWQLEVTSGPTPGPIDRIDVDFSAESTPEERLCERLVLVITLADSCQTEDHSWRFSEGGLMYRSGQLDYLDEVGTRVSQDNMVLTMSIKALSASDMNINFSFLAMRRKHESGRCKTFASKDPSGQIRRPGF